MLLLKLMNPVALSNLPLTRESFPKPV
uniref:Uncharacterized protein n=1 Tax=Anguilla anguilla TaxID=7936 RepID=A0A0E9XDC4_ANGAN